MVGTAAGAAVAIGVSATSDYFSTEIEGGLQSLIDAGHAVFTSDNEILLSSEAFAALAGFENVSGASFVEEFNSNASDVIASGGGNFDNLLSNVTSSDFRAREYEAIETGSCFLAGTPIDMWPRDPGLRPDADGLYDEAAVRAKVWQKPIEDISPGDWVLSFDKAGNLQPGKVTRTFTNQARIVLDFFGTGVTPGHVYYRADSDKAHKFETLIDILRDDGVIQKHDGTQIRAATGLPLADPRDGFVWAVTGDPAEDGSGLTVREKGKLRLGTRFITDDGKDVCIDDLIKAGGGIVTDDGLIRVGEDQMPFHWAFSDTLPKPEDYILKRSGTTLADINAAGEWEDVQPIQHAPMQRDSNTDPAAINRVHGVNRKQRRALASLAVKQGARPQRMN